jgi:hypothetical protein
VSIPPDLNTVEKFLEEFRASCPVDGPYIVDRDEYTEFIEESGIQDSEITKIVLENLNKSHYFKGPNKDRSNVHVEGIIYEFKYRWDDYIIYVKLKVPIQNSLRTDPLGCLCLSFHEDNF